MVKATRYNNINRMCLGVRKCTSYGDILVKKKEYNFVLKLATSKWERKQRAS